MSQPFFIAEVSSNHAQDFERAREFIHIASDIGCDAVKFQLFKIDQLFAPEILAKSPEHQARQHWELPSEFIPDLAAIAREHDIQFSCTPFYIDAVAELKPHVDFYKIASYELPWDDLITACARTGKRTILSTGMATLDEVTNAANLFTAAGGQGLEFMHCVSSYPTPLADCNLAAIETIRNATGAPTGWSDHSRDPAIITRAIHRWQAASIEFHLDLDGKGAEFAPGHCWLPEQIADIISIAKLGRLADGSGIKAPALSEMDDRPWRADPSDGLRPTLPVRENWRARKS